MKTKYSKTGVLALKDIQYKRWRAQVKYADKKLLKIKRKGGEE